MDNKLYDEQTLYEKMSGEQDFFRQWLLSQPPEEILNHAYEYAMREDILMAMETEELTDAQTQALLSSDTPLADVYRYYERTETDHMYEIRDSIKSRANDICRVQEALRKTPIYPNDARYAAEHGEQEQYRASRRANLQCKEAIETAVKENFDGRHLNLHAAKGVIQSYGMDRVTMILASTVQRQDWDGRYSPSNKDWAKAVPFASPNLDELSLNVHPAVLNGFISLVRTEQQITEAAALLQNETELEL